MMLVGDKAEETVMAKYSDPEKKRAFIKKLDN